MNRILKFDTIMDRHAYLIQAHSQFGLLELLLQMLDDERNDIFIHIDKRSDAPLERLKNACSRSKVVFVPRIEVRWGGPSQIWSELILLKEALSTEKYAYLHLLSGVDLPIKSQDYIHQWFAEHKGTEFISFCTNKRSAARRLLWAPFPEHGSVPVCLLSNNIVKAVQQLFKADPSAGLDLRMGANWFSITGELAQYVLSREEWIRATFAHRTNCDELFLQTLVWPSEFRERCLVPREAAIDSSSMANLRYVDWEHSDSSRHPKLLDESDLENLKKAPQLFARKFSAENRLPEMVRKFVCGA